MYGFIFVNTAIQKPQNIYTWFMTEIPSITMCLIFSLWLEKNPGLLIDCFSVFELLIYINLLTILCYPEGLYRSELYTANWFLGYKNPQIRTILPVLSISLIKSYKEYGKLKLRAILLLLSSAITFYLTSSATSLIGIGIFLIGLFLFHTKKGRLPRLLNLRNIMILVVILFVIVVMLKKQSMFSYIVENVLGRDLTFTYRTDVWDMSLDRIKLKPLWGYGYLTGRNFIEIFGRNVYSHPHNYIMYNMMIGGICLVAIQLVGFLYADKSLNKTMRTIYSKIVFFCLSSFLIMGISESLVSTVLLYPMVILGMRADALVSFEEKNTKTVNSRSEELRSKYSTMSTSYKENRSVERFPEK
jgi:O-antigen ligase